MLGPAAYGCCVESHNETVEFCRVGVGGVYVNFNFNDLDLRAPKS